MSDTPETDALNIKWHEDRHKVGNAQADSNLCDALDDLARRLERQRDALAEALQGLHDDNMDYLTRNKLGGENNHWMVRARAALCAIKEQPNG